MRLVNERIAEVVFLADESDVEFLCECGDPECLEKITMTRHEFAERAKDGPILFPGHTI
jgi:hypothetical protein